MSHTVKIRTGSNVIAMVILALFILFLIREWGNIPDTVPTHFGVSGAADAYGEKSFLLIIPVLAVLLCSLLAIVECFPKMWNFPVEVTDENRERLTNDGLLLVGILKILLAAIFSYIGICSAKSIPISWPMYILLGAIAVSIIVGIARMIKHR